MHTDYPHIIRPWTLMVDHKAVASFLCLEQATEALWGFMQDGRSAVLIRGMG